MTLCDLLIITNHRHHQRVLSLNREIFFIPLLFFSFYSIVCENLYKLNVGKNTPTKNQFLVGILKMYKIKKKFF
ncbi:unnamed protein product [Meloidogyne enterolobii]|uniref:Uncharacterized protein n=1 Tax=Meloidogyne enterolobii TaxID=390850 RepID=A0ACB0YQR2_MELEN